MKKYREFLRENTKTPTKYDELLWWLEDEYEWDYVESEGLRRTRFDWRDGGISFWLNDDMTGEGQLPERLKDKLEKKGVKIYN